MTEQITIGEESPKQKSLNYDTIEFKNPESSIQTLTTQNITDYHPEITLTNQQKTYQKQNNDVTAMNSITINTNSNNETIKNYSLNNIYPISIKEKDTEKKNEKEAEYVDIDKILKEKESINDLYSNNEKIFSTEANVIKKNNPQAKSTERFPVNLKSSQNIQLPKSITKYDTPQVRLKTIRESQKESATCKKTNIKSKTKMLDNLAPIIYVRKIESRNNLNPLQNRLKNLEEEIQKQNEYDYKRIMKEFEVQYQQKLKATEQQKEIEQRNQKFQEKLKIMEEYREKMLKDKIKKIQDRQKLKIQQHEKRLKTEANNNEKNLKSVGSDQDYGDDIYNLNSKYKAQMIRKMQKEEEDNFCLETEERLKLNEKEHRRNYLQYLKKLTKKLKDGSENYNERYLNCMNLKKDNEEEREENFIAQDSIKRYNYSQNVEREKSAKKTRISEILQKNKENIQEKKEMLEQKEKEKIKNCIKRLNRKNSNDSLKNSHDHYLFTDEKRQYLAEKQKENLLKTKEEDDLRIKDYIWDQGYYVEQLKKMQNIENKKQYKVMKNIVQFQRQKDMKYQSYFDAVESLRKNNIMNQNIKMKVKLYSQKKLEDKKREELEKEKKEEENKV